MRVTSAVPALRPQLLERRARLQGGSRLRFRRLIDAALQRVDAGTFGICESCHESIEADRLQVNPLIRFCLDHLSGAEMRAHQQDLDLAVQDPWRGSSPVAGLERAYSLFSRK